MNNDDRAKELLASSYHHSAERIRAAIRGRLETRNSREPNAPPSFPKEVVGLCGQGGRHPYFTIPINTLEGTLKRIERSNRAVGLSIDITMEEIAAACQDLRQQTLFDSGTGCVNDSLPSMVPLLPPEEIWFDGRELPLDVWRLVCFEFDLVSSSVSLQVSVEDFAFSAVTQSGLAFRFLINQLGNRRVSFDVEFNKIPKAWLSAISQPYAIDVSLARLFFEAGSLLTPLATQDFSKWYGAVRYLHWIDGGAPDLRVKDEFDRDSVDCRYRGLFAEETAVGLMAVVLSDVFRAHPINNTVEVLPRTVRRPGKPIADFVAQATEPTSGMTTTIIAESKGSLGKRISKARHDRAKKQVSETNVLFSGSVQTLPLAFGSTVCFSAQTKEQTRCIVDDPAENIQDELVRIDPLDGWRVAYAKSLKFVGLETAAQQVLRGDPAEAVRPIDFDRELDRRRGERDRQRLRRAQSARQRFGMDLVLDVGSGAVSLDTRVLDILRHGINSESPRQISEILDSRHPLADHRFSKNSFETSLGFGCISYSDLDQNRDSEPEL